MLYSDEHYDIIYPNTDAAVSQESDNVENPAANSPSQDQGGSCSGEKSGEQKIAAAESSTGEK
jgi:hypothetical protein